MLIEKEICWLLVVCVDIDFMVSGSGADLGCTVETTTHNHNHSTPTTPTTLQPNFLELPGEALQFLFLFLWINQDSFHIKTSWSTRIAEERGSRLSTAITQWLTRQAYLLQVFPCQISSNWGIQWNSEKYVWRHIVKELIIIWRTNWGNDIYIQCVTEKHLNISACMCFSSLFIIIFWCNTILFYMCIFLILLGGIWYIS